MMKKTVLSIFLLFMIVLNLPASVFAHSELESADPAKGAKVTTDLEAVILTFSTKIESLSTMKLKNESKEIPLQISLEDNQMTGKMNKPLENGNYTVEYKIIGADSHVIEGNYTFSVNRPEQAQPKDDPEKNQDNTEQVLPEQDKTEQPSNPSYFGPLTIGLVIVIAVVSFIMFRRKR